MCIEHNSSELWLKEPTPMSTDARFIKVLYCLSYLVGFVGNGFAIYVLGYRQRGKRSISELLFLILSASDLLASAVVPVLSFWPLFNVDHPTKLALCIAGRSAIEVSTVVSQVILVLICIERFRGIVSPMSHSIPVSVIAVATSCGMIAGLAMIVPFWFFRDFYCDVKARQHGHDRKHSSDLTLGLSVFIAIRNTMVMLVLTVLTISMVQILKRKQSKIKGETDGNRIKNFVRARKLLLAVIVCFGVCNLPGPYLTLALNIISRYPRECRSVTAVRGMIRAMSYTRWLTISDSAINPVLYSLMHPKFASYRHKVKACFLGCFCLKRVTIISKCRGRTENQKHAISSTAL